MRKIIFILIPVFIVNIILFGYYLPKYNLKRPVADIYREYPFEPEPILRAKIVPKFPEGYRLRIQTKNFDISEICTFEGLKKPIGHVHIYVNDVFWGMLMYKEFEPEITNLLHEGQNKITLMLFSPDHKIYLVNHKPVSQTISLTVDKNDPILVKQNSIKNNHEKPKY